MFCTVKFTNKFDNNCRLRRNVKTFNAEKFADDLNSAVVNLASNNLTASSRYFTSPWSDTLNLLRKRLHKLKDLINNEMSHSTKKLNLANLRKRSTPKSSSNKVL